MYVKFLWIGINLAKLYTFIRIIDRLAVQNYYKKSNFEVMLIFSIKKRIKNANIKTDINSGILIIVFIFTILDELILFL